jgi:hypothetical protein
MIPLSLIHLVDPRLRPTIDWALSNVGVSEIYRGSNRGPEIDDWARDLGSPPGGYWCALAVARARKEAGLWIRSHDVDSPDEWVYQARKARLVGLSPTPGAVVVYTRWKQHCSGRYAKRFEAVDLGLVVRVKPQVMAMKACTNRGKYNRSGVVLGLREVENARVLCYIPPRKPRK